MRGASSKQAAATVAQTKTNVFLFWASVLREKRGAYIHVVTSFRKVKWLLVVVAS